MQSTSLQLCSDKHSGNRLLTCTIPDAIQCNIPLMFSYSRHICILQHRTEGCVWTIGEGELLLVVHKGCFFKLRLIAESWEWNDRVSAKVNELTALAGRTSPSRFLSPFILLAFLGMTGKGGIKAYRLPVCHLISLLFIFSLLRLLPHAWSSYLFIPKPLIFISLSHGINFCSCSNLFIYLVGPLTFFLAFLWWSAPPVTLFLTFLSISVYLLLSPLCIHSA